MVLLLQPSGANNCGCNRSWETRFGFAGLSSGPRVTGPGVEQTKREPLLSNYSRISEVYIHIMLL